jgi:FMN phosphatase YigB (HAD superfamily)
MSQKTPKIKIAFDLDGVIVDTPPLIPKSLLELLFRGTTKEVLHYRFPKSKIERLIRKISHFYLFRPPINKNIEFIKELAKNKSYKLYLISGRYSFIKAETENWLNKREIAAMFDRVYLNLNDEQPHLFKERILKEVKPQIFIDDDDLLLNYLIPKFEEITIYHFSLDPAKKTKLPSRAKTVTSLTEVKL